MNALKYLMLALEYLPHVLAGVQAVEATIGSQAHGTAKKQIVLAAITAANKVGGQVPEAHVQAISALIDSVVGALNQSGLFAHSTAAPVTPAPVVVPVVPVAVVVPVATVGKE